MTLEQIKADLLYKDSLDKVVAGDRQRKYTAGMKEVPVKRMIDAVDYIDKNMLPAVKKKKGEGSADYEFFKSVCDFLLWAVVVVDRYEQLESRWVRQKVEIQLLRELVETYEKELSKYTTMEDLLFSSSLDIYARRAKDRAADLLKSKKG
jgi:hypothetical protein